MSSFDFLYNFLPSYSNTFLNRKWWRYIYLIFTDLNFSLICPHRITCYIHNIHLDRSYLYALLLSELIFLLQGKKKEEIYAFSCMANNREMLTKYTHFIVKRYDRAKWFKWKFHPTNEMVKLCHSSILYKLVFLCAYSFLYLCFSFCCSFTLGFLFCQQISIFVIVFGLTFPPCLSLIPIVRLLVTLRRPFFDRCLCQRRKWRSKSTKIIITK